MTLDPSLPRPGRAERGVSTALPFALDYDEVQRRLAEAGFRLEEAVSLGADGRVDRARWTRGAVELGYFRDLATGLATIVAPAGVDVPLPSMDVREAQALVVAADPRAVLAGLQAAAILGEPALAPELTARLVDPDPVIARHAADALRATAAAIGRANPAALGDALFAVPGWRREKLQLMRWLGRGGHSSDDVHGLLGRALEDSDWEIRVTAMLAAVRLGIAALARPIGALELPEQPSQGVTNREHSLLRALRDAGLARLGEACDRRMPAGVESAIDGDVGTLPAGLAAFTHALVHPLPDQVPAPPPAGPAVQWASDGPRLVDGNLLAWIPPLPHWLGEEDLRGCLANRAHRAAPARGFFIDAEPRGDGTFAEASAAAASLARQLGRPVSLPTAEQWEMAARGPDGRRYPWGMNARAEARIDLSPWGVAHLLSRHGEWVTGPGGQGHCVAGSKKNRILARFTDDSPNSLRRFRFCYRLI